MASKKATQKKSAAGGKPLVIVESPAKARTIGRFLGSDYAIEASVGHIRDLPANAAEVPAKFKGEKWARLGIDIDDGFRPLYVVPKEKRDQIKKLKALLEKASALYLATDEDREGEAISWHLVQELKPKCAVRRMVFHEITKTAIQNALSNPRDINADLVEAQETRRLVDRIYGYQVSPLLWKKIRPRLSAGRVQSVAVKLVVNREKERMRFVAANYWGVAARFEATKAASDGVFDATLQSLGGQRIATGKDFDPDTGELKPGNDKVRVLDEATARSLTSRLQDEQAVVRKVDKKPYTQRPSAPFTTSTLQQEAGRKLRFAAKRTMQAAQRLYENGFITYMRTDSTTLSDEALSAARSLITDVYGKENLPDAARTYQTKVRNAQEAHEAIRPAGSTFRHPREVAGEVNSDEARVYELIWQRTVASQMKDARGQRTTLTLAIDDAEFSATGRVIEFPGFRLAYVEEGSDGKDDDQDRLLPDVVENDVVQTRSLEPTDHSTQPPPRLTEATLVREMEARGIGRPSTYASIIETILARDYCYRKGSALVPTFTAFAVVNLLDSYLPHLVDYAFTAKMEDDLDEISNGEATRLGYLTNFFNGNGAPGLKQMLEKVEGHIDPREICSIPIGATGDGDLVEVRVGRYGPFVSCNDVRASVPDGLAPDELTLELALDLLAKSAEGPKSLGTDPDTGLRVYVKNGRFGLYFQLGDAEQLGDEKPKMASLLAGMDEATVSLAEALAVLSLPRTLGSKNPPDSDKEEKITAQNGRFGPYLRWGKDTRSIPAGESPLTVTLERALEIFAQPKARGRGQRAAAKVLKELGQRGEAAVKVLDGRYGPYVTDGSTNASVPKGESVEDVDLARAISLLEEREAMGKGGKPKATKKASPRTKKTASKKTAGKKARKKTASK